MLLFFAENFKVDFQIFLYFINYVNTYFTDICKIFTIYLENLFANYKTLIYICIVTTTETLICKTGL